MRVLVVHHGALIPTAEPAPDRPVTGGALRASVHVDALRGAGHTVVALHRDQDGPGGFRSAADLRRLARAAAPDWILCVAPEEAPALRGLAPLVVDLYAPRVLEGAWEGLQTEEAGRLARAVEAADEVLYSNDRQRWLGLGALGLCGWDLSRPAGRVVPLAALPGPRRRPSKRPVLVAGGHPWPWQDLRATLTRAVALLGDRAEVHTYGLPPVPGVVAHPLAGRATWLAALAGARAALDRYAPNPERALAFSFRQADALGCGLPLISDPDVPLSEGLRRHRAGWVDEPLEAALESALAEDRSEGARRLAAEYAPARTEAPLLAWTPAFRDRGPSLLRAGARLDAARARAEAERARREAAEAEVERKRAEVAELSAQVRALAGSVEALTAALTDVAAFRRETARVLGARLSTETTTTERLRVELEVAREELRKKDAELAAVSADRDRLGKALGWLRR